MPRHTPSSLCSLHVWKLQQRCGLGVDEYRVSPTKIIDQAPYGSPNMDRQCNDAGTSPVLSSPLNLMSKRSLDYLLFQDAWSDQGLVDTPCEAEQSAIWTQEEWTSVTKLTSESPRIYKAGPAFPFSSPAFLEYMGPSANQPAKGLDIMPVFFRFVRYGSLVVAISIIVAALLNLFLT